MKKTFDENKRMQLLVGSRVRCITDKWAMFTKCKVYNVIQTNCFIDDFGIAGHTWSIAAFRESFIELTPFAIL